LLACKLRVQVVAFEAQDSYYSGAESTKYLSARRSTKFLLDVVDTAITGLLQVRSIAPATYSLSTTIAGNHAFN